MTDNSKICRETMQARLAGSMSEAGEAMGRVAGAALGGATGFVLGLPLEALAPVTAAAGAVAGVGIVYTGLPREIYNHSIDQAPALAGRVLFTNTGLRKNTNNAELVVGALGGALTGSVLPVVGATAFGTLAGGGVGGKIGEQFGNLAGNALGYVIGSMDCDTATTPAHNAPAKSGELFTRGATLAKRP